MSHSTVTAEVQSENSAAQRICEAYARRQDRGRYSWFRTDYVFTMQQRERHVLALLRRCGLADQLAAQKILDVGCGNGAWLRDFIKWGARSEHLFGVDLLSQRVEEGRRLCPAAVHLQQGNAAALGFPDASFDIVLQATVFTSILDAHLRRQVAAEMLRVLKPDGWILWYDFHFNNPRNPDVRGVKKAEIRQLFPACEIRLERTTLAPPLARTIAPVSWWTAQLLEKLPWLRTHYLGIIRRT